jgi:hypothetical protein
VISDLRVSYEEISQSFLYMLYRFSNIIYDVGQSNQARQNSEKHTAYQKGGGQQRSRNNFNNVLGNSVRGRAQQNRYRT